MKKLKIGQLLLLSCAFLSFSACNEKKTAEPPVAEEEEVIEEVVIEEPVVKEEPKPEPQKPAEPKPAEPKKEEPPKEPEKVAEVPKPKEEEKPPVEEKPQPQAPVPTDEYTRSVGDISVSKDDFEKDKKEILRIIDELAVIMKERDYKSWLTYIDSESTDYWQKPANLKKAQKRLPVKGLTIRNLQDYFKYVFIPSRQERTITEIRYESSTYVKAVQVEESEDIVFYYFNKINGKWMLHLPPIEK